MKLHNHFFALIVSLTAAALNWSCQVVALGPKLDLEAPRLSIARPVFAEIVLEKFELAGTVTDNIKTTLLTVNIEKVSREWKNDQGIWQTRETPESPWQPCAGVWSANGTSVNWSLSLSLNGMPPGDYEIAVNSFDESNNNDAQSAQRIKITYRNENPFFTVLDPVLKTGTSNDVPQVLKDMDDRARQNPALIGELYNESVSVNYDISGGDFSRGGTLIIYLAGPSPSNTDPIAGTIWYEKTIPVSKRIGSITISHAEIKNSTNGQPASGRTPLQIISRVTDSLMKEEFKSSGWFMWWPESDKPWAMSSAGSDPTANPYTKLYESGEDTVYAYDDDGAASLRYSIHRWDRKSQQTIGKVSEGTVSFGDHQSEWLFTVPNKPEDYRIATTVTDTHGVSGDTAYAYITAIKRPSVTYKFLTRISSSNTDGTYKAGDRIDIVLDFDVPVIVGKNPKLKLNIEAGNSGDRYAQYVSGSHSKTLYFTYTMQDGDHTPGTNPLDITAIDTSGGVFSFTDTYGDEVNISGEIKLPDTAYRLAQQKKIYVLHGKPVVTSTDMADGILTVQFDWPENPFSWNMVRGNGNLTMEIEENDYRIPSVIPKARYEELGIGGYTDASGTPYYELTINGAFYDGGTDTDPKYVLRFDLDTTGFGTVAQKDRNLRNAIRDKEKISLSAASSQVTVSSHTLTVNASSFQPLKGVKYNLFIPKGFLTDSIVRIDSDEIKTQVLRPGVEKPFFRIEKKDEEIVRKKDDLQAHQPATAQVKLDCRTPGAEIYYTDPTKDASFTVDPVENYLLEQRKEIDNKYYLIPSPQPAEINTLNSTVKTKPPVWREHPHPDKLSNLHRPVKPPSSDPEGRTETYTGTSFKIGSENYALGGMAYRLTAVAYSPVSGNVSSEPSYEVAYRSVLVFNNTEPPPGFEYSTRVDGNSTSGGSAFKFPTPYNDGRRVRIWIIGGDSAAGSVLTPGFPLSWNTGEYDKVRLMTPVGKTGVIGGGGSKYSAIGDHINNTSGVVETMLTENNIPLSYDPSGTYTWYWITWKLGNAAYVQFQRRVVIGSAPQNPPFETASKYISNLKQGWNNYKDYYPVFPGETRVVNPTTPYWYREGSSYQ
jgi:hypothetical protein